MELTEFLFPAPAERRTTAIVRWWEARRLPYNLIVGAAGVFSVGVVRIVTLLPPDAHDDGVPLPIVLVFGILANLCFLLGPAVEISVEKLWGRKVLPVGPTLFRMGLTFSVGLALLPTLIAGLDWGFRILRFLL